MKGQVQREFIKNSEVSPLRKEIITGLEYFRCLPIQPKSQDNLVKSIKCQVMCGNNNG